MNKITKQAQEEYTNKDYELYEIVEKLAYQFGTQHYGTKTRIGLTKETCEEVDRLVAYVKEKY